MKKDLGKTQIEHKGPVVRPRPLLEYFDSLIIRKHGDADIFDGLVCVMTGTIVTAETASALCLRRSWEHHLYIG